MSAYDVVIVGGGPAGIAAAAAAAAEGVRVALVESNRLGGACVHETCVPTEILMRLMASFVGAQQLDFLRIAALGSGFNADKAVARKDELVRSLASAVTNSVGRLPIDVLDGFARFVEPGALEVRGAQLDDVVTAGAFVLASGCAWSVPAVKGLAPDQLITPDVLQSHNALPGRVAVLSSRNSGGLFPLEYASYLNGAGTRVNIIVDRATMLLGLDSELDPLIVSGFETVGCAVHLGVDGLEGDAEKLTVRAVDGSEVIAVDAVLAADPRTANLASSGADVLGLSIDTPVSVNERACSSASGVFAAGDVIGAPMLSSAASAQGTVAGANAAGGSLVQTDTHRQPYVLHGQVPAAWVGMTEDQARAAVESVVIGIADANGTAQAVVTASEGTAVKLVADGLGQVLGAHAVGEGSHEIIEMVSTLIGLEATVDDVAVITPWHPSWLETLVAAAHAVG